MLENGQRGIESFLPALFKRLAETALDYAVLRNYQGLPETKAGNDIDFIIRGADRRSFVSVLRVLSRELGWRIIQFIDRPYALIVKLADGGPIGGRVPDVLHLDFFTVGSWYGARFLEAEGALARRRAYGVARVQVVDPIDEAVHLIAHHFLWTGFLRKDSYRGFVSQIMAEPGGLLRDRLRKLFGSHWAERLIHSAIRGERLRPFEHWMLRLRFLAARGVGNVVGDAGLWLGMVHAEFRQVVRRPGALVGVRDSDYAASEGDLGPLTKWLRLVGQFNHAFTSDRMDDVSWSGDVVVDERVRRTYDGTWGRARGLQRRLRSVLRRGWVVLYPLSERTTWLLPNTDIVLSHERGTALSGPPVWRNIVMVEYGSLRDDGCQALARGLATKCERQWWGEWRGMAGKGSA